MDSVGTMNPGPAIHVCHIISGDLWAGAEVMDYHLLRNLKRTESIKLSAILFNEGRLTEEIRSLGIPVSVVNEADRNFLQMIRDTERILTRTSPDILHSHRYKENVLAYLSSRRRNGIRLVSTQHGMPETIGANRNAKYLTLHRINRLLLSRYFHKVVAVSEDVRKNFVDRFGFPGDRLAVIHNGTEIPEKPRPRRGNDLFRIGSMGRIYPVKDFPLMVEIAREVSQKAEGICFELAGDGPDLGRIRELVGRYGLGDHFHLRGSVERAEEFYRGIDLYLNTSLHEGIPMSVLEAMANGIPVVAPRVGGLAEILDDGRQGYLVEGRNPKDFARTCLELYRDHNLWESMGSSARDRVKRNFSNERMADRYLRLYFELAEGFRFGMAEN